MLKSMKELKKVWCPQASIDAEDDSCVGCKCMAWRWYDKCEELNGCNVCSRLTKEGTCERRGYCGLAGKVIVE